MTPAITANWGRRGRALTTLLLLLGLVVGCGRQPEPAPTDLITGAASAVERLKSVHFVLQIEGAPAYLDAGKTLNLRQAEGDILRPDRARAAARVAAGGFIVNVRFINIGPTGYMTDPLSGRWGPAPPGLGYNAGALFDAEHGVSPIIRRIEGLKKDGDDQIEGLASHRLSGQVPTASLLILTGGVLPGEKVTIEVWVAKDGLSVRQIRLTEIGAAKTPMTWTLTFSRHDEPVTIDAPI